jgi:hypothetical protein
MARCFERFGIDVSANSRNGERASEKKLCSVGGARMGVD